MTLIFEQSFPRTLDVLVAEAQPGSFLEAWTFDDTGSRRAAEAALAAKGVRARIRSAYKPLVQAFREEISLDGVVALEVQYPVHPAAPANRFRLEAYPLAAMVGERPIRFVARADAEMRYDVLLTRKDGGVQTLAVLAPNRLHEDFGGEQSLSPTGWRRTSADAAGERLETDCEALFDRTMSALAAHAWGGREPYFEELTIRAVLPGSDERLPVGDEALSLAEALHEDFYFSLLEFFQKKSGRPLGDRGLKPGQIVPEILCGGPGLSVRVEMRPLSSDIPSGPEQGLETATASLSMTQIAAELEQFAGAEFTARTRSGRVVRARHVSGSDVPVMISGGQHANETSGVVGALRGAKLLAARDGAHFTISPLENPDGYALHQRLCRDNPRHMHHAARYTALGDDLEYRTPETAADSLNEKEIRYAAQRLSGAQLHLNLHGYPSHEWTRPFSGYVPRNFALWTVPKGFFLVLRHQTGWEQPAEQLLDRVTRHLGGVPGLLAFNQRQIGLYEIHAGDTGFRIINGFPCLVSVNDQQLTPVTLITEYPDETVYGDDFVAGHEAQTQTVLSAYEAWQDIMSAEDTV